MRERIKPLLMAIIILAAGIYVMNQSRNMPVQLEGESSRQMKIPFEAMFLVKDGAGFKQVIARYHEDGTTSCEAAQAGGPEFDYTPQTVWRYQWHSSVVSCSEAVYVVEKDNVVLVRTTEGVLKAIIQPKR